MDPIPEGTAVGDLYSTRTFAGFGPDPLRSEPGDPPFQCLQAPRRSALCVRVRQECPRRPGVYGMLDAQGELIYVGKAKDLRARLLSYFRVRNRDPRSGRILANTAALVWELAPNELAALLREQELIYRWRPRFNVQGQPARRRLVYVCLGRRPAAHVYLAPRLPRHGGACFGPISAGERARQAVRWLNDWFRLRDCPQAHEFRFADQIELFPILQPAGCPRHELNTCLAPCAAACTWPEYAKHTEAAKRFLEGQDRSLLVELEATMTTAAQDLAFERAVVLRDKLNALNWMAQQLDQLRQAQESNSFVYRIAGPDHRELWYLIHRGRVHAVLPRPRTAAAWHAVERMLTNAYRPKGPASPVLGVKDADQILLIASWFRRHPTERARTIAPSEALAECHRRTSDRVQLFSDR